MTYILTPPSKQKGNEFANDIIFKVIINNKLPSIQKNCSIVIDNREIRFFAGRMWGIK